MARTRSSGAHLDALVSDAPGCTRRANISAPDLNRAEMRGVAELAPAVVG